MTKAAKGDDYWLLGQDVVQNFVLKHVFEEIQGIRARLIANGYPQD
jgi:hypothetical protein